MVIHNYENLSETSGGIRIGTGGGEKSRLYVAISLNIVGGMRLISCNIDRDERRRAQFRQ